MNGVEILASTEVTQLDPSPLVFFGATVIIFIAFCLVAFVADSEILVIVGAVLAIFVGIITSLAFASKTYETQYQVTISEDVNFVEFNNKYEILNQEGKIYTVKEKE